MLCVDFEAEVEDDIGPIFRRGEVGSLFLSINLSFSYVGSLFTSSSSFLVEYFLADFIVSFTL
jgi:hypothetical protein